MSQGDEPYAAGCVSFATYRYYVEAPLVPRDAPSTALAWQTQGECFS